MFFKVDGTKLWDLCQSRGWTETRLAKEAGINRRTVGTAMKSGEIQMEKAREIAQALDSDLDAIRAQASLRGRVPPPPRYFAERPAEVARLLGMICAPTALGPARVALLGGPGAGKSTLLKHLCRLLCVHEHFADGVLWVEIGRFPTADVMKPWCQELLGTRLPDNQWTESNWATMIKPQFNHSLLRSNRLLAFDDVWSEEDAKTYATDLGGPNCVTLVSTRCEGAVKRLFSEEQRHRLPNMAPAEAMDLFVRWAPSVYREFPDESIRLIEWLERLPLTVDVAAHLLNSVNQGRSGRRKKRIADLLKEITHESRLMREKPPPDVGEKSVAAVVEKTLDFLSGEARKRFLSLGVIQSKPATFDAELIADYWRTSLEEAETTLSELEDFGLLEYRAEDGRYYMHALLRDYARSHLEEPPAQ
jgi:hypothetical protein